MTVLLNPLSWQIPIVNVPSGTPTPEFMRQWQRQAQINATIVDLSTAAALSKTLDKLGSATGDIIYRASTGWTVQTPGATNTVLAISGGLPTWSTISAILDSIGSTQGDILYRDSSGWQVLAPGTSGNFLKTQGASANPVWAAVSAGSGTVNSGTAGQVAYYASSTNAVSGEALSTLIDSAIGSAQGDILYRDASVWQVLAPGTSGKYLKTQGAGANPVWDSVSGGGGIANGWALVVTATAQSKTSPTTTSGINTTGASLIIVGAACASGQSYTVTDNKSNTYTGRTVYTGGSVTEAQLFYCINPTVGSGHTFSLSAGGNTIATIVVFAFSWSGTTITYMSEAGTSNAVSTSLVSTGVANPTKFAAALAVSVLCIPNTDSASVKIATNWNAPVGAAFSSGNFNGGWMAYRLTSDTEIAAWSWSTSSGNAAALALFAGT